MRVAVVLPRGCGFRPDRANSMETVVRTLAAHARSQSAVTLICDADQATAPDPRLLTVPPGLGGRARNRRIKALLETLQPDVVEYHQQLKSASDLAAEGPPATYVLYRHTRIKPPRHPLDAWRYGRRLARFDRLVFVSEAAGQEFAADYPALADRVSVVCNPIAVEAWRADPADKEKLILFCGRAMADKGLDLFCIALARTLDAHPDWRGALVLGDWERHQAWADPYLGLLDRFGDRVEILKSAPLEAVRAVTRRAAIAATPSRVREALGLTALEAHAAGCALVSSGRGGLREASGDHALYVEVDGPDPLAAALERLITDPETRLALARSGQTFVAEVHAPEARAAQLDRLREAWTEQARRRRAEAPPRPRFSLPRLGLPPLGRA
ncbi:MAG: glycosyltransferase family 4 protein [Brevundimonas aurantiaca]|jgi:glycosyltransferase involved in cell wall biosynthesis|uniref:glycosyltransferase family 4 protein n=1 Tax=Brevundimonas aurantiaca TaxID=74316 RepID=UPI002EAE71F1|nr:glycosyltransferase family 4 protein [Pseudomonadota bacterium]